ncbi:MAG TPA: 30S ribosomal protein S17 [Lentisphaeria bacterium]|nr:30S ribosomal protein S17 [Lentisphaeria bacterium]|tara:strand:- start:1308 stop:1589 length:282 start_codon:yes stop_codon:yes gene_type:complete
MSETTEQTEANRGLRKTRTGTVVGANNEKTIAVRVDRRAQHARYKKVITRSKKFHVHDERNEAKVGDTVRIRETRPLSKLKRWRLIEIIRRAE